MRKGLFTLFAVIFFTSCFAQQMHVKQPNVSSFNIQERKVPALLDKMSSAQAKQHPEYGILPFNAQCRQCVELIDKRTIDSRLFIDPKKAGHTWSQKSYFPLHYKKDSSDVWHTTDPRLRLDENNPGVYVANNQPVPTKLDLNKRNVSLNLGEIEFSCDNNLTMYFFEEGKAYSKTQTADYSNFSVGEEGLTVSNLWNGINMHEVFGAGKIETSYTVNKPLGIPVNDAGFMVIEDHFTIPAGYTFEEESPGLRSKENYYRGDYILKNKNGEELMRYDKPIYTDANSFGMHGYYNLIKAGNNYTLQMMVPVSWLRNVNNQYPLVIDPVREGSTKVGNYLSDGGATAEQGFTTYTVAPGYCPHPLTVPVPGNSQLTNAYVQVEWQLKFDNTCQASPPALTPFCSYDQVWQVVYCDSCQTYSTIMCKEDSVNQFTVTCTTDPTVFPGADSTPIITNPPFLFCYKPQCADYIINFTLRNSDSVCNESCGVLCAIGNLWIMTVEANALEDSVFITADNTSVCPGQPITHTAHPSGGFPPYYYEWIYGNKDTMIYDTTIFVLSPQHNAMVKCLVFDNCGNFPYSFDTIGYYHNDTIFSNILYDTVLSAAPFIQISGDTLISSVISGNQWYRNDSILSGDTGQMVIDSLGGFYTVTVYDSTCGSISSVPVSLTGIDEVRGIVSGIGISPNPSNGNFVLKFVSAQNLPSANVSIYNSEGRLMDKRDVQITSGINNYSFQTGERLSAGVYYLNISAAGNSGIKQRFEVEY